ncbi:activator of Hsp90 ATPase [Halteromyces radiatus]|uniref:activator of Hsp90 ATPase n=1 Tax=Halteromyces radiatus TaxID=101107 RepID=UPI0022210045|nr:activator of Hsp90 ATPase [Halteromyces radiatus]KAI8099986.1 activator of Hsp90 ATPase [Halteromyces radiatus]
MSNWKNVNNWHWVNKNCLVWAQTYFTDKVVGLETEKDGHQVKISKMDECTGDVEVCQRKGKIITIYDVNLKYSWEGVASDGTKVSGTIHIPEVAHDTEIDEYVFEVTVKEEDTLKRTIRDIVKRHLTPLMSKQFDMFSKDLISHHGSDVYIQADQLGTPAPLRQPTPL